MPALTAVLAAGSVFLFAVYLVRARVLRPAEFRIRQLQETRNVRMERDESGQLMLRRDASAIPALSSFLSRRGYVEKWAEQLQRADSRMRAGEYFLVRLALAVVGFLLIAVIGRGPVWFLLALVAGAFLYMVPAYWLALRVRQRVRKIDGQLVETITLIANGIRAGFAFAQGVDVAAQRMGPPISVELNRMLLDINLGASLEDALRAMNDRIGSEEMDMVVTAILIQRNTGGNLVEILENVATTMRERERIQGEIRTMTAQQRLTGWVLSCYPIALAGLFFLINPKMTSLLWTTGPGIVLLIIWATLNVLGFLAIKRILDIDI